MVFSSSVCEVLLDSIWGFENFKDISSNGSLFISTSFIKTSNDLFSFQTIIPFFSNNHNKKKKT